MKAIWIGGGTSEGRLLAAYACRYNISVYVSVATVYGAALLPKGKTITVIEGRMDYGGMKNFLEAHQFCLAIDATHPYAAGVTENMKRACADAGVPYLRIIREDNAIRQAAYVSSMEEAAGLLCHRQGNIFLTTGSKTLDIFTVIPMYQKRIFARILPFQNSLDRALSLGYEPAHIICMQGPFSAELNAAMFRHAKAAYVVTKDSGRPGGVDEKAEGARRAGAKLIVVGRKSETGISLAEGKEKIRSIAESDDRKGV